jgi:UDP-4-amino-4,6-dideoxy-N-acetyl-beta-L-altrosamine N-acetyltransferase
MLQGFLVNLAALEEEHIELLRRWRTSPEIYDYLFDFNFISKEQQKLWYRNSLTDISRKLMIIEDQESQPLGFIQLGKIDYINRNAEWGFFIGEKRRRYGGYAAEAEFLLLKYAFDFLNLNKIYGYIFTFNKKVLSMHRRYGFKEEGTLKKHIYHQGNFEDIVMMSIFKSDYENIKDYYVDFFMNLYQRLRKKEIPE